MAPLRISWRQRGLLNSLSCVGARFLAKRDGIAIANACEVLARHSPESYEQYREQLGECLAKIVLDTQAAHIMAKAREIHFQAEFVTAKLDDQKPGPCDAEQDGFVRVTSNGGERISTRAVSVKVPKCCKPSAT